MKFHLMRKPNGSLIVSSSNNVQYDEVHFNFSEAVRLFGKLCEAGEAINGAEWERRILARQPIGKVGPYIIAIRCCMASSTQRPKAVNPLFGWTLTKALIKDFFSQQEPPLHE